MVPVEMSSGYLANEHLLLPEDAVSYNFIMDLHCSGINLKSMLFRFFDFLKASIWIRRYELSKILQILKKLKLNITV